MSSARSIRHGARCAAAVAISAARSLALGFAICLTAHATEPFAGQRELLQQHLAARARPGTFSASALAAVRLGGDHGQPEMLLLGTQGRDGPPLTPQSRFELGSVTKALTGSLLARMAAQRKVGLDDPVERWMPELAGTPAGRLTLRSLATHHSGLPRLPLSPRVLLSALRDPGDPYRRYSEAEMLAWLRDWGGEDKPEFVYSNLGFALLGKALERAAGQPLARLMESEILRPAGAAGAGLDAALAVGQIPGYNDHGRATPPWTMEVIAGAGALRADTQQMLALLEAARQRRAPFDAGAERTQVRLNKTGAVGLGWMRTERHGDRIVWHNGGTGGFRSFIGYSEVSGRAVLLMANGHVDLDPLGMHLINAAFAVDPPPTSRATGTTDWFFAVIALLTLATLAWRAWAPRSRLEQGLTALLGAAYLALGWRIAPAVSTPVLVASVVTAVALVAVMAWRGRHQPLIASAWRTAGALVSAAAALLLVAWLW